MGSQVKAAIFIAILLFIQVTNSCSSVLPTVEDSDYTGARSGNGIDIKPTGFSFSYPNSVDQDKYQMFSSNYPLGSFNRDANLFVVDGMLDIDLRISITLENMGVNTSGSFPNILVVEHDEYTYFDLLNVTVNSPSINPGSTATVAYTWAPTYSGNHTIRMISQHPLDDDSGNDILSRHLTVGNQYRNCDDFTGWSVGSGWSSNSDAAISKNVACHIGNGASNNYGNSMNSILSTPVWDFSDRHPAPSRAIGMSFFVTGSAQTGDGISFQARKTDGTWQQIGEISGTIDSTIADGTSSWTTFTNAVGGHNLPLAPIQVDHLHSNSQFRYVFTSNSAGTDIGYWLDELIWYYDQRASIDEYDWRIGNNNSSSAQRGQWTDQVITIHNDGNISDRYVPAILALPAEWEYSILHETGGNVNLATGIEVLPGQSHNLRIKLRPGPNATVGQNPYQLQISSLSETSLIETKNLEVLVEPSYVPAIVEQITPALCPPGSTCEFYIGIENIGEGSGDFTISVSTMNVLSGWTLGLAWDQDATLLINAGQTVMVKFVVSIPSDAVPELESSVWLQVVSSNDSSKTDTELVKARSSMVSIAEVSYDFSNSIDDDWSILPNSSRELTFTVWNNASRLDNFNVGATKQGGRAWTLTQPSFPTLAVNPYSSSTFTVEIHAPSTGQVGDLGPVIIPHATSILSGSNATSTAFELLTIEPIYDVNLSLISSEDELSPGANSTIAVEIKNQGNGPVEVDFSVTGIPADWQMDIFVEGILATGTIHLSPTYESNDVKYVELVIWVPQEIGQGEEYDLTINANVVDGEDINLGDNQLIIVVETLGVKRPEIIGFNTSTQLVRVSETKIVEFEIHNIGNIVDSGARAKVQIQTLPQTEGVTIEFMPKNLESGKIEDNRWLGLTIPASGNLSMEIRIIISDHVQVGTNVALTLIVEGGEGENGQPIVKTQSVIIEVYERRDVNIDYSMNETAEIGQSEELNFLVWSNSSISETLTLTPTIPELWSLNCDGLNIVESYDFTVVKSDGLRPSSTVVKCKIIGTSEAESGNVTWVISDNENNIISQAEQPFSFESSSNSGNSFLSINLQETKTMVVGIVSIAILAAISLLILARRRQEDGENEENSFEDSEAVGHATQPVSSHAENAAYSPQTSAQVPVQPLVQPQVEPLGATSAIIERIDGYTVTELLAAGWTQAQIDWRRQELHNQVIHQSGAEVVSGPPVEESGDENSLGGAFAALGG